MKHLVQTKKFIGFETEVTIKGVSKNCIVVDCDTPINSGNLAVVRLLDDKKEVIVNVYQIRGYDRFLN